MSEFILPERSILISYLKNCGKLYWNQNSESLDRLPIPLFHPQNIKNPLKYVEFNLPEWAQDLGIMGKILVPQISVGPSGEVDWWLAAFLLLSAYDENSFELQKGPIHSYSFRLKEVDTRIWDAAWVNRIFLFLRRWSAQTEGKSEEELFGQLPPAKILLTHDVDAVSKTWSIRVKQSLFYFLNFIRFLFQGKILISLKKFFQTFRFFLSPEDFNQILRMQNLEKRYGIQAEYNFFGGGAREEKRSLGEKLIDPAYDVKDLENILKKLTEENCEIGLHPSYLSWKNSMRIKKEARYLSQVLQGPLSFCRQHWLMFSWQYTWEAQSEAGFKRDSTLGFNNRSGFRNSAALEINPWNYFHNQVHTIKSLPLILMDSQIYDYQVQDSQNRGLYMKRWIDEVKNVHGIATILWHPHAISKSYGWEEGFKELLEILKGPSISE